MPNYSGLGRSASLSEASLSLACISAMGADSVEVSSCLLSTAARAALSGARSTPVGARDIWGRGCRAEGVPDYTSRVPLWYSL